MAETEAIQTTVMQVAIQAATVAVTMLRADAGAASGASMANEREAYKQRHGQPPLRQPSFDWNAPDKHVELLSFEVEVINILYTKMYEELMKRKSLS